MKVLFFIGMYFCLTPSCIDKNKTRPCTRATYFFDIEAAWMPQKDVYKVGDTITLVSKFSNVLVNQNGSMIDYSNAVNMGGDLGIALLDSVERTVKPGKDSFGFVSKVGSFVERTSNQNYGINTNYFETNTGYEFECAIICKKKGVFGFGYGQLISTGLAGKNCTNAGFSISITNSEKHQYLHYNALGLILTQQDLRPSYFIRVID